MANVKDIVTIGWLADPEKKLWRACSSLEGVSVEELMIKPASCKEVFILASTNDNRLL